ncbi:MAG TPA: hypothetical protein VFX98_07360 [Longimicrobiaceae bacterium]|nr:hypothetical protein [Longimicrobiaceae bacterium]
MKKAAVFVAAALAASVAVPAGAQICAGFPTVDRQFTFGARMDFPEGLDQWGVEASYNASGPLAAWVGLNVASDEDIEDSEEEIFVGGLSLELPMLGTMIGSGVSVCGVADVAFVEEEDDMVIQVPVGLGLGANLSAGPGVGLAPYVIPALYITHFDLDDPILGDFSDTEYDFGIRGGALLGFGMFFVGGEVKHVFVEDADPQFGIRAGIRL